MHRGRYSEQAEERAELLARIEDLELRMKLLEARVRNLYADRKQKSAAAEGASVGKQPKRGRPRGRCPGCLLELPPGRKGESCVWCGFRFDALAKIAGK